MTRREQPVGMGLPFPASPPCMLYVHVPFCRARCRYCAFASEAIPPGRNISEAAYLDGVRTELALAKSLHGARPLYSVFLGGGTPSLLSPAGFADLFETVRRTFPIGEGAEITAEGNPDSLADEAKLTALTRCGVNRLSMGVQSLDDSELRVLGRVHDAATAVKAFRMARSAGFGNIGMDLIWGVPGQTGDSWRRTLETVVLMEPEHVSAYGLSVEPGTPLAHDVDAGRIVLPDEEAQARFYEMAVEFLEKAGYVHYEISNFCRKGYVCRHNMGYWEGRDYIGIGPSAVGTVNGRRAANPGTLAGWLDMLKSGSLPAGEELTPAERLEEFVMLSLRTSRGLDCRAYEVRAGHGFARGRENLVEKFLSHGLARLEDGFFRLTDRGMLVSNAIMAAFFD